MKTNIDMQMNMQLMFLMYTSALSNYRNTVNQRHPDANNTNKIIRRIHTLDGCGGKGRGVGRGNEHGGQEGIGRGSGNPNTCCND